jgi:hypothetical protein
MAVTGARVYDELQYLCFSRSEALRSTVEKRDEASWLPLSVADAQLNGGVVAAV